MTCNRYECKKSYAGISIECHDFMDLEPRLNSRAIFEVTPPTPLLSANPKFSLPVYLESVIRMRKTKQN